MKKTLVLLAVVAIALFGYGCKQEQNVTATDTTVTDTGMSSTSSTMSTTDSSATGTTGTMSSTDTSMTTQPARVVDRHAGRADDGNVGDHGPPARRDTTTTKRRRRLSSFASEVSAAMSGGAFFGSASSSWRSPAPAAGCRRTGRQGAAFLSAFSPDILQQPYNEGSRARSCTSP